MSHNTFLSYLLVMGLAFTATGCSEPDFPKYSTLGDLRILAIVLDTPEASPGDTVTFTPILSDLNGQGRTIEYSVHGCIDPGVGIGAVPQCTEPDPASMLTGTLTIPAGSGNTYTGPATTFALTMPAVDAILGPRSPADQYNGVSYLVFYRVSVPGIKTVDSFVRVVVSAAAKTGKNLNPSIAQVTINSVPIAAPIPIPASIAQFKVTTPPEASEAYQFMRQDGSMSPHTEKLITTWFASDGLFDFTRTIGSVDNAWEPPLSGPSSRGMVLVVVTRDERGGTAYRMIEMN